MAWFKCMGEPTTNDFYVLTFGKYAKFNGSGGYILPFQVNADYKVTVVFYEDTYINDSAVIGNTMGASYSHLTEYNNKWYTSSGSVEANFGSWVGNTEHTFINNNGNGKNEFDGEEVTNYTPTTVERYYTVGCRGTATSNIYSGYIRSYKIESLSTGDVICELRPAVIKYNGLVIKSALYDIQNDVWYDGNKISRIVGPYEPYDTGETYFIKGTADISSAYGSDGMVYLKYLDIEQFYDVKEYIEVGSTSGPYIDTGITCANGAYFYVKGQYTQTPSDNYGLFGSAGGGKEFLINTYSGVSYVNANGSVSRGVFTSSQTAVHDFLANTDGIFIDGEDTGAVTDFSMANGVNYTLFGWKYSDGTIYKTANAKIYRCKIWNYNELVRDFIPVQRKSDDEVGMLDLVNNVFYTNDGTGSFTCGGTSEITQPIIQSYVKYGTWKELIGENIDKVGCDASYNPNRYYLGELIPRVSSAVLNITASSIDNTNFPAWHAFDGVPCTNMRNPNNCWSAGQSDTTPWIQYKFDEVRYFTKISITCLSNYSAAWVGDIKVLGSLDGEEWYNVIQGAQTVQITAPLEQLATIDINLDSTNVWQYIRVQGTSEFTVYYNPSIFFDEIYVYGGREGIEDTIILKGDTTPDPNSGANGQVYLQTGMLGCSLPFDTSVTEDLIGNTWTTSGSPVLSTAQSKFGGKSLYLDGSSYLQSAAALSDAFNFEANDFTITAWIYPTSTDRTSLFAMSVDCRIGCDLFFGKGSANMWLSSNGSGWNEIQSDTDNATSGQGNIALNANEWTHIAFTRSGNKCRMFVNGQLAKESTITSSSTKVYWDNTSFRIGAWGNSGYRFTGYIDDFNVINGVCLWNSAFTVPTEPVSSHINDFVAKSYAKVNGTWRELIGSNISDINCEDVPAPQYDEDAFYQYGTWLHPEDMTMLVTGGSVDASGNLYFDSTTDICGVSTDDLIDEGKYKYVFFVRNMSSTTLTAQFGSCTPGYTTQQIIGTGQGRGGYSSASVASGDRGVFVYDINHAGGTSGVFAGMYPTNNPWQIEKILRIPLT